MVLLYRIYLEKSEEIVEYIELFVCFFHNHEELDEIVKETIRDELYRLTTEEEFGEYIVDEYHQFVVKTEDDEYLVKMENGTYVAKRVYYIEDENVE